MKWQQDFSAYFDDDNSTDKNENKFVQVKQTINQHMKRRVLSEIALEKELSWHFEKGVSYHCFSWGDVDSELAHWYKNIFDGVISFERNFDDVKSAVI